jgi:hypothetical protein
MISQKRPVENDNRITACQQLVIGIAYCRGVAFKEGEADVEAFGFG